MSTEIATTTVALTSPEQRRAYLARVVPPETVMALNEAHEMFFGALASTDLSPVERTMLTAKAVTDLTKLYRGPVLKEIIMPLMNTAMGFDTDKNPAKDWGDKRTKPYGEEVVLTCAVEATLRGLPMVGNVWNIIGGGCYIRKEGFELLVGQLCRYTEKVAVPEVPEAIYHQGGYLSVPVTIKHDGYGEDEPGVFHGVYAVRVNKRSSVVVESVEGKAKRKAFRDLYAELTGIRLPDGDVGDDIRAGRVHQVGAHYGPETGKGVAPEAVMGKDPEPEATEPEEEPTEMETEPLEVVDEPPPKTLSQPKIRKYQKAILDSDLVASAVQVAIKEKLSYAVPNLPAAMEDELVELLTEMGVLK